MSVQKRGTTWRVRWREGGRHRSREFDKRGDATRFDQEIRRRQQLGPIAGSVLVSKITLTEFVRTEWWPLYAVPNLKSSTRRRYAEVWSAYLLPRIGGFELQEITPALVEDLRAQLHASGLGLASQRKALLLLQGILRRAVVRGLLQSNPVPVVDKPKAPPTRRPEPLSPETVERIRDQLRKRDATLVSLLAYAGLRPEEATSARWGDLGARTLFVQAGKTGRARTVDLVAPLVQDLAEWRMLSGRPDDSKLIFPRDHRCSSLGDGWELHDYQNWRRRVYQPAARKAGVTGDMRVYRLRGSFVSLMLWEGRSLVYVAEQAGHSVATLARHYAGVVRELEDQPRVSAAEAIRDARAFGGRLAGVVDA